MITQGKYEYPCILYDVLFLMGDGLKSPVDGNKPSSLPRVTCQQEGAYCWQWSDQRFEYPGTNFTSRTLLRHIRVSITWFCARNLLFAWGCICLSCSLLWYNKCRKFGSHFPAFVLECGKIGKFWSLVQINLRAYHITMYYVFI